LRKQRPVGYLPPTEPPHRPGPAPALGLRAGTGCPRHSQADCFGPGDVDHVAPLSTWLAGASPLPPPPPRRSPRRPLAPGRPPQPGSGSLLVGVGPRGGGFRAARAGDRAGRSDRRGPSRNPTALVRRTKLRGRIRVAATTAE